MIPVGASATCAITSYIVNVERLRQESIKITYVSNATLNRIAYRRLIYSINHETTVQEPEYVEAKNIVSTPQNVKVFDESAPKKD